MAKQSGSGVKRHTPKRQTVKKQIVKKQTEAQRAAVEARAEKVRRFQAILGAIIVGLVALSAIIMSVMGQLPVPVTVGVVLLVGIRLYILKREITSEQKGRTTANQKKRDENDRLVTGHLGE